MSDSVEQEIVAAVGAKAGITLAELLDSVDGARNDIVFNLLLTKQIYTDLTQAYLDDQDQVHLFLNSTVASFYTRLAKAQQMPEDKAPRARDLLLNTTVLLNGNPVELLMVGKTDVITKTKDGEYPKFSIREFEKLIREGQVIGYQMRSEIDPEAKSYREAMRRQLTDEQMLEAIEKEEIVKKGIGRGKGGAGRQRGPKAQVLGRRLPESQGCVWEWASRSDAEKAHGEQDRPLSDD